MSRRLSFIIMAALALWVAVVAVSIELQNAAAGHYLPRRDDPADGTWRTSILGNEPRDRLYKLVVPGGLLQYVLAPLVAGSAVYHFATNKGHHTRRSMSAIAGLMAVVALGLALYRGYYGSLAW